MLNKYLPLIIFYIGLQSCIKKADERISSADSEIPATFYVSVNYPNLVHCDSLCPSFKSFSGPFVSYSVNDSVTLDNKPVLCGLCKRDYIYADSVFRSWITKFVVFDKYMISNDQIKKSSKSRSKKSTSDVSHSNPGRNFLDEPIN